MGECMTFPDTVEEFMDSYKIVDTKQVYTNGTEMVPIYRMRQWFEHEPERKKGKWVNCYTDGFRNMCKCSECGARINIQEKFRSFFCYHCGAENNII